jgi:hypothetical protein
VIGPELSDRFVEPGFKVIKHILHRVDAGCPEGIGPGKGKATSHVPFIGAEERCNNTIGCVGDITGPDAMKRALHRMFESL